MHTETLEFMKYLNANPAVRSQIHATHGKTMLYAGTYMKPMWKEVAELKRTNPNVRDKETLPDVLRRIRISVPGKHYRTLLEYAEDVEKRVPWKPDGFIMWRALSGIFAQNASGAVSFCVGSGVTPGDKVFAATEVPILLRNPRVDSVTKDALGYYERCIKSGKSAMNFSLFRV
jgi:hypothetical protein